jgi:nitrous oxide reductase accessory protein NosL
MTFRTVIALTLLSASIAGCTAQARSPEEVPVDRVECARCRMLISSEAGGGQIVSTVDDTRFYDDLACLAADWSAHAGEATAFVRVGPGWREAAQALYARPDGARTPMQSGLVAFATADEARAADRDGRALAWDEVVAMQGGGR